MKMPRFFIVLVMSTVLVATACLLPKTCSAESLPIVRVDPRAGDPDMPGSGFAMPFDAGDDYSRIHAPYVPSSSPTVSRRQYSWTNFHVVLALRLYLGRKW